MIAFGKLSGKYKFRLFQGAPVLFPGQHMLNLVLGLLTIGLGLVFMFTESWPAFFAMLVLSFVMGVLIIIPIGGADMPVVVSMLNSYSGWAAAGIGFIAEQRDADHRRLAGRQLGRDPLLHHVQGDEPLVLQRDPGRLRRRGRPRRRRAARSSARSRAAAPTMRPSCCPTPRP